MNRCGILATIALALAPVPWTNQAVAQEVKKLDRPLLRKAATALARSTYQPYASGTGPCHTADANALTRKVWVAALNCPSGSRSWGGFRLASLTSAGPVPGARVVATFEVSQLVGEAYLYVSAPLHNLGGFGVPAFLNAGVLYTATALHITEPGTYTVTGPAFTLKANVPHDVLANAYFDSTRCGGELCAASLKVTEIKWVF